MTSEPFVNSRSYWERRFDSGDWHEKGGRQQTRQFAEAISRRLDLPPDFDGTLLDFGCGLGDGIPVYHARFPRAALVGVDFSGAAVASCRRVYGAEATFLEGDHSVVPAVEAIVASNVLEHLGDHESILASLLDRARDVFVAVPYREQIQPGAEHVNRYDEGSFAGFPRHCHQVFSCRGWSQYGWALIWTVYAKNPLRLLLRRRWVSRSRQILYHFHAGGRPERLRDE